MSDFFKEVTKSIEWGGKTLKLTTGKIARLSEGAVLVEQGNTSVLAVVSAAKQPKEGIDFFPLTVNYIEKFYASGKIPGGFNKREGKPTERETLTSRLIDRPIRPMFPEGFFNEVQICCTVLSYDADCESDILAMIGASAALMISGVPFLEPIAGARVGYIEGEYVINPTAEQRAKSSLDLSVAGTKSSVLMVESEAQQLSEETMLGAVMFGHEQFQPVIAMINEFIEDAGKPRWEVTLKDHSALEADLYKEYHTELEAAYKIADKVTRRELIADVKARAAEKFIQGKGLADIEVNGTLKKLEKKIVRGKIIEKNWRIDGRDPDMIRPIVSEVDLLPKAHGSALFTRGETQALAVITLGSGQDEQMVDDISGNTTQKFMLHYNFPPYSVGDVAPLRPPGRREIGHGNLASRALRPVLPAHDAFPYTIRVVVEILACNGSSSMATVCSGALAMMAAGVPLAAPVAGIAMGLVLEGKKFVVLSDILGDEDNLGDMDFKVAGTANGITALQMDIKINGINQEIMEVALAKAKVGRMHILEKMLSVLESPREELNPNAPRITTIKIDKEKIREIIGTGGKVIRELCEKSSSKIDIDDDGTIRIASVTGEGTEIALRLIADIVAVPELGRIYEGKVVKITDFGAFINYMGNLEGLLHISEMGQGKRVENVTDVLSEGDMVTVKLVSIEKNGKVRLSMNLEAPIETGGGFSDRGGRGGDRGGRSGGGRDRGGDRGGRDRGGRSGGDRERGGRGGDRDRGERSSFSDRGERGSRDRGERGGDRDRGERSSFSDRAERGSRDRGDRPSGDRDRGERGSRDRGDRPGGDRGERSRRPERSSGGDGPAGGDGKKRRFF